MITLANARVVTPSAVIDEGWVSIERSRITAVGAGTPVSGDAVDLRKAWLLPGFIDLHMHGGGGHDVAESSAHMAAALAFHRTHGTTRSVVSLVAAPVRELSRQLGWVADLVAAGATMTGHAIGAHLEGPFLSPARCGAQNPKYLMLPDRSLFAELVSAARDCLLIATVAPELPGALGVIADAVASGVIVAIGHTDASYADAEAAVAAGATLFTHLFNGMRPLHHREPGVVAAALNSDIACEVINDGRHVHPAMTKLVARTPGQLVLVTDAIAAAGAGDGNYVLGDQHVRVREGEARLVANGALAGSTLTMDEAVRRAVLECAIPIRVASAGASGNPARVLGIDGETGSITVGRIADLVVLDDQLRIEQVMAGGRWCALG